MSNQEIDNSIKDFDILAKEERRSPIRVGGRVFSLPRIPAIASMMHSRFYYQTLVDPDGSKPDETEMKLRCLVACLNAGLPEPEWIDKSWVEQNIPGSVYDDVVDHVLGPLYTAKQRKQERNQQAMLDLLTPGIKAMIQEELAKKPSKNSKPQLLNTSE